jgi:hypothetical protein
MDTIPTHPQAMFQDLDATRAAGFVGFHTIRELRQSNLTQVPQSPGVYLILRPARDDPVFLARGTGGRFKGRDPTVDAAKLALRWVADSPLLYVGKAGESGGESTLHSRLRLYIRFGAGVPCGHWGGRYIWQLADAESLLVAWRVTAREAPRDAERQILAAFKAQYGRLPFANCQT